MNRHQLPVAAMLILGLCAGVCLSGTRSHGAQTTQTLKTINVATLDMANMSFTGHCGEHPRRALAIAGQPFEDGFWMRGHAFLYLNLDAHGVRFTAQAGVDDSVKGQEAAVELYILGDGRELWKSGLMKVGDPAKPVNVDLAGVKTLVLAVLPFSRNYMANMGAWADARIETDGADVQTVPPPREEPTILTPPADPAPRINAPRIYGARPGHPFIFTLPVTGERPMQFEAVGLPGGLALDAASGIITGAADKVGDYDVKVTAANARGKAEGVLRIKIGDRLALTPPMGWNDWYSYTTQVTDEIIRGAAKAMIDSGMNQYGYAYVNIDDCWMVKPGAAYPILTDEKLYKNHQALLDHVKNSKLIPGAIDPEYGEPRDSEGKPNANPKFPDMKSMTDYIHSLGLKAGLYTSPGPLTCAGYTSSYLYEDQDAERFAEWGFDFLKYDWCSYGSVVKDPSLDEMKKPYLRMNEALLRQPRDIIYNFCQYGMGNVWEWAESAGAHCWRTAGDLGARSNNYSLYSNLVTIGFGHNGLERYAGPGHWNDPDYLLFGPAFGLTPNEHYSYMTLWSLLSVPLIYSGRMDQLDPFILNLLCNAEVIEVNQDALGHQASLVARDGFGFIWAKKMEDGSKAVGLFNVGEVDTEIKVALKDLGLTGPVKARDLWRQKDLGAVSETLSIPVVRHGAALVRLSAQ